jgi:hypothetical protein
MSLSLLLHPPLPAGLNCNMNSLTTNNLNVNTLNTDNSTISSLNCTNGTIGSLSSTNGTISSLSSTNATISSLSSTNGTITSLSSTNATITSLSSTNIDAQNTSLPIENGILFDPSLGDNTHPWKKQTWSAIKTLIDSFIGCCTVYCKNAGVINVSTNG